jgi:hypothetical protein
MSPPPVPPSLIKITVGSFTVFGGPLAWFAQLYGGFALASQPCVVDGVHMTEPLANARWTGPAMILLLVASLLVALCSFAVAWQSFNRAQATAPGMRRRDSSDVGVGRSRFLAVWGMLLASVFALATAMSAIGFFMLPRCAG